jgi:hypothetical protein
LGDIPASSDEDNAEEPSKQALSEFFGTILDEYDIPSYQWAA